MSVSDPMLKRLKACVLQLRMDQENGGKPVGDLHPNLMGLCEILEDIFRRGLNQSGSTKITKKSYWHVLEILPDLCKNSLSPSNSNYSGGPYSTRGITIHPFYDICLKEVHKSRRVQTPVGKGRLMLRLLLQKRLISWPVEALKQLKEVSQTSIGPPDWYDDLYSIIGNEILSEILLSLLKELNQVQFALMTKNAAFLDITWQMPDYKEVEFVPCKVLGLDLVAIKGYQVVDSVIPGEVAEENKLVTPGDILDELLGYTVANSFLRLKEVMRENEGLPVQLSLIKMRLPDGTLYHPIVRLYSSHSRAQHLLPKPSARLTAQGDSELWDTGDSSTSSNERPIHSRINRYFPDDVPAQNPSSYPISVLRYVGCLEMGRDGGVRFIEESIARTLAQNNDPSLYKLIRMELGEKDVTVFDYSTGEMMWQHAYPTISSCGRRIDSNQFFAYIVGDSTCTNSTSFVTHVFQARSEIDSKNVLCAIAQGFDRTHWAL